MKYLMLFWVGILLLVGALFLVINKKPVSISPVEVQIPEPQASPIPSPSPVSRASPYEQWQIHFTYAEDLASKANQVDPTVQLPPREVTVTSTPPLRHAILVDTAGRKTETWFDGATTYLILPNSPQPNPVAADSNDLPQYLNSGKNGSDLLDAKWANSKTYSGVETIRGIDCLIYRNPKEEITVWVDSKTQSPVRWQKGDETRDFYRMETPPSALTLPSEVLSISKAIAVVQENNERKPVRGQ